MTGDRLKVELDLKDGCAHHSQAEQVASFFCTLGRLISFIINDLSTSFLTPSHRLLSLIYEDVAELPSSIPFGNDQLISPKTY